jgi:membrane protein
MSLLPFLVFVFTFLGIVGQADQGAGIIDLMFRFMLAEVALTLQDPVVQVVGRASGGVLTLSIIVVLWITASGVEGIRSVLNREYRTRETRGTGGAGRIVCRWSWSSPALSLS